MDVSVKGAPDMEDDEVYSEKSQIHRYLQSHNFSESYEVYNTARETRIDENPVLPSKRSNWLITSLFYSSDLKTFNDQVDEILMCGLVAEEHISLLANLFDGHQRAQFLQNETLCPIKLLIFSSGVFSAAWSSAMYCLNKCGSLLHFLPMTVPITSWAFFKAHQRYKRKSTAECVTHFIQVIDKLLRTVKKSVRLVQENELFVQAQARAGGGVTEMLRRSLDALDMFLLPSLREIIFARTTNAIGVLLGVGKCMAEAVPVFCLPLENDGIQLNLEEILTEDHLSLATIKNLRNLFILSQSEVLLRLALTLCSSLRSNPLPVRLEQIFSSINFATEKLNCLETDIDEQYQRACLLMISPSECSVISSAVKPSNVKLVDVYSGVVTAVTRLQAMLLASRVLKVTIENFKVVGDDGNDHPLLCLVEKDLTKLTDEADSLFSAFHMSLEVVKKMTKRQTDVEPVVIPKCSDEFTGGAVVEQEDYIVEDEVFELYCATNDGQDNDREHCSDLSMEDPSHKEMAKRSAIMVKELKTVLKEKAEEWKVREEIALRKRADIDDPAGSLPRPDNSVSTLAEKHQWGLELETSVTEDKPIDHFPVPPRAEEILTSDLTFDLIGAIKSNSLRNMFPVREDDEEFCCSGDESEEDTENTVESR